MAPAKGRSGLSMRVHKQSLGHFVKPCRHFLTPECYRNFLNTYAQVRQYLSCSTREITMARAHTLHYL